jgi:hypothetical protein
VANEMDELERTIAKGLTKHAALNEMMGAGTFGSIKDKGRKPTRTKSRRGRPRKLKPYWL